MIEHEVPHDEWHVFLTAFNARHQGWLVQCDHFGRGMAQSERSPFLPFFEVSFVDEGTPERFVAVVVKEGDLASIVSIMPRPDPSAWSGLRGRGAGSAHRRRQRRDPGIAFRTALLAS